MATSDDLEPFSDPFRATLGYQLRRSSVAVMAALARALEPMGLKPSEATLILLIGANPGSTQSAISRAQRAKPANLVPLINRLAHAGILERTQGRGRSIALSLSKSGQVLHDKVTRAFERNEAQIMRNIPEGRRDEMIALLRQICSDACCPDKDGI